MQFGIKSLLGATTLLAGFVMGVFEFSEVVCAWTLILAHSLSPAIWVAGSFANQSRGLKTFFLSGLITGITPWIATSYWCILLVMQNGLNSIVTPDEFASRLLLLAVWSSSGVIAIVGGLLGYWIQACCRSAIAFDSTLVPTAPVLADPLGADTKLDR